MSQALKTTQSPNPLLQAIKHKVLPRSMHAGMERVIVLQPDKSGLTKVPKNLPAGTILSKTRLKSSRAAVKGPRLYGNRNFITGVWPEDGLIARKAPSIIYILSGQADIQTGELILHCREGDLLLALSDTPLPDGTRSHVSDADRSCELLWLDAAVGGGLGCWICHSEGKAHINKPRESCYLLESQATAIFTALIEEAKSKQRHDTLFHNLFISLLISVSRDLEQENIFQFVNQMEAALNYKIGHDPIVQAQEYINSHLHKHLTIDEVARHVYLSRAKFTKLFRQSSQKSFVEYLTERRLEEAKSLLTSTDWSVDLISRKVGLTYSRLRIVFWQSTGMSPNEYRQFTRKEAPRPGIIRSSRQIADRNA